MRTDFFNSTRSEAGHSRAQAHRMIGAFLRSACMPWISIYASRSSSRCGSGFVASPRFHLLSAVTAVPSMKLSEAAGGSSTGPSISAPDARGYHRTKTEHLATILLPKPAAAYDTSRSAMDYLVKILKENRIMQNRSLRAEMGAAAFQVRSIRPLAVATVTGVRCGLKRGLGFFSMAAVYRFADQRLMPRGSTECGSSC